MSQNFFFRLTDGTKGTISADSLYEVATHAAYLSQATGKALAILVSPRARKWHINQDRVKFKRKTN